MPDLCGVGARACPIPARPTPEFDAIDEAGGHRILLDISDDFVELSGIANPAVPGFLSPEGLSRESKNLVGFVARGALQPAGDRWKRYLGRDQEMDVVWHDNPGVQFVEPTECFACFNGLGDQRSDAYIAEPARSRCVAIKNSIRSRECMTRPRVRFQDRFLFADGNRSVETAREKDWMSFVVDVRELSSVEEHLRVGRRERLPHISGNCQRKSQRGSHL